MIPTKTILAWIFGGALAALAGWIGLMSVGTVVAPQGDFSFLAEVAREFSPASSSPAVTKPAQDAYTASALAVRPAKASIIKEQDAAGLAKKEEIPSSTPATTMAALNDEIQTCTYATKQFPNYNRLIFNEIAWMGTKADSSNEWIELKNTSEEPLELEGYQLIDKAEQIKVTLPKATLPAGGFYLLERAEEGEQVLEGSLAYTGALSNSNEGLRLFDKHCFLVDQVEAMPKWPAGEATSKKSMERGGGMNWYTFTGSATSSIWGTPGAVNTAPISAAVAEAVNIPVQEVVSTAAATNEEPPAAAAPEAPAPVYSVKLLISKVQVTGGPGKTTEDFVEFYNPGPGPFNLKGYRLVKRTKTGASDTSIKSWTAEELIAEGATYRWANTGYPGEANARTSGSIANDNAVAVRLGSADTGEVIDAVGWGAAANSLVEGSAYGVNPGEGQFLVRKNNQDTDNNSADFEVQ